SRQAPFVEGLHQRIGIVELAARHGDEISALLNQLELLRSDHTFTLRSVRSGDENDIRQRQHRVQPIRNDRTADVRAERYVFGIDSDYGHTESAGALRDLSSDATHSNDNGRLAAQLYRVVIAFAKLLLFHVGDGLGHVSSQREQQRKRVISDLRALDDLAVRERHVTVDEFRET